MLTVRQNCADFEDINYQVQASSQERGECLTTQAAGKML